MTLKNTIGMMDEKTKIADKIIRQRNEQITKSGNHQRVDDTDITKAFDTEGKDYKYTIQDGQFCLSETPNIIDLYSRAIENAPINDSQLLQKLKDSGIFDD